jgi:glutathione S-transferase
MTNTAAPRAAASASNDRRPALPSLVLCELQDTGLPAHESYSPFCVKVHRALRAAGLPYTRRHSDRPDTYRPLNPAGQVPVLLVGDEPVFDSTRILARIEQLAPEAFDPLDPRTRAEAHLWEELGDTSLNGFLVASRWADERNWEGVREAYFAGIPSMLRGLITRKIRARVVGTLEARDVWRQGPEACWRRFEETLDQLEARAPRTGFWLTDRLTAADFALFGQLHSLRTPLTAWQSAQVTSRPQLTAYLDRVNAQTRLPASLLAAA